LSVKYLRFYEIGALNIFCSEIGGLPMMKVDLIELTSGTAIGLKLDMGNAPLLLIKAPKGFVMCGYLNMDTANKLNDVAVKVTGVKTFDDVLNSKVVELSSKAEELGIQLGMTGRTALEKMF
jgi:uncharacterized protein YunC (DUF1805 family)